MPFYTTVSCGRPEEKLVLYNMKNTISLEAIMISRRFAIVNSVCLHKDQTSSFFEIYGVISIFLWAPVASDDHFE